jgi:hypothetical protein
VVPVKDRLILKLNAAGQATMRFWVTRRFLALFWKALTGAMRKSVADAKSPAARDFLLDMAETRLMAKADFATKFQERAPAAPALAVKCQQVVHPGAGWEVDGCRSLQPGPGAPEWTSTRMPQRRRAVDTRSCGGRALAKALRASPVRWA